MNQYERSESTVCRGAQLSGVDMSDCDLTGATFDGATLRDANLRGADLTGADLTGAKLDDVIGVRIADEAYHDLEVDLERVRKERDELADSVEALQAALDDARHDAACLRERVEELEATP